MSAVCTVRGTIPSPEETALPPTPSRRPLDTTDLALVAARAAADKSGTDTVVLEVGGVLAIVEHFVITGASNTRQVRTIAEEIEDKVRQAGGGSPLRSEGLDDAHWVLLDYGDVVAHVFLDETRLYYELERLWADVPRLDWEAAALAAD